MPNLPFQDISQAARLLGIDYSRLREEQVAQATPVSHPIGDAPANIRTMGKEGMREHVIAVKSRTSSSWPIKYLNIIELAKTRFDNGTHIMCQETRKDGWVILYSVPRSKPVPKRAFFRAPLGGG